MIDKTDDIIKQGLAEIDNEIKQEEDIREQSEYIARMLALTPVVRVSIDNTIYTLTLRMVPDSQGRKLIMLAAQNDVKKQIAGNRYTPALYTGEYNDEFTLEENCQTVVSTFVAKACGQFKVQALEDEGAVKIAREKDMQ